MNDSYPTDTSSGLQPMNGMGTPEEDAGMHSAYPAPEMGGRDTHCGGGTPVVDVMPGDWKK